MKEELCFGCPNRNGCTGCSRDYKETFMKSLNTTPKQPKIIVKSEPVSTYNDGKHIVRSMKF